ncbi:MAG: pentapeptide repeat-containing protein, partial [Nitrospinia bacterium]
MKGVYFLRTFLCLSILFTTICFLSIGGCAKYSEEVQANLDKLEATKSCSGCNLTGVELMKLDLTNANLTHANLTNANLSRVNL